MSTEKKRRHKILKIIGIIILVIILLVGAFIIKAIHDSKLRAEEQKLMIKSDEELIGEHLYIDRDEADDVDVNLYRYESDELVPLVINLHGGAFVAVPIPSIPRVTAFQRLGGVRW